jgi:hypothetical protein
MKTRWILLLVLIMLPNAISMATRPIPAWASYVQCKLVTSAACLNVADQTVTGGANFTPLALTTGNNTIDCGARPGQYVSNTGAFTITAPANDGYCYVDVENGGGAGAITLSGFSPNAMGGATVDTTNGHNFRLMISRVHGHSAISAIALQ